MGIVRSMLICLCEMIQSEIVQLCVTRHTFVPDQYNVKSRYSKTMGIVWSMLICLCEMIQSVIVQLKGSGHLCHIRTMHMIKSIQMSVGACSSLMADVR